MLEALEKWKIDAGHTWEPVTSQAIKKGYKILGKAGDLPGIITDVLAFHPKVIQERPDEIQRIVDSLFEARDLIYSNSEEALEIMSKAEGMSKEEMEEGIKGVHHPDLKENIEAIKKSKDTKSLHGSGEIIIDFYLKKGQLSRTLDINALIEPRFLNQR